MSNDQTFGSGTKITKSIVDAYKSMYAPPVEEAEEADGAHVEVSADSEVLTEEEDQHIVRLNESLENLVGDVGFAYAQGVSLMRKAIRAMNKLENVRDPALVKWSAQQKDTMERYIKQFKAELRMLKKKFPELR